MRRKATSSVIVLFASVLLLLTVVVPAAAAPPGNPFVGSWETIYDDDGPIGPSEIHSAIGGNGHFVGQISVGRTCSAMYGEPTRGSYAGSGSVISEDPYIFEAVADLYCYPQGQGRQLIVEDFYLKFQYEAATNTLWALHYPPSALHYCSWRSGSDASACDT